MIPCRACGGSPGAPRVGWRYDEKCRACGAYGIDSGGPVADAPVPAPPAPRRPVAGWYQQSPGRWQIAASTLIGEAYNGPWGATWSVEAGDSTIARGSRATLEAAQLAAEDALRAVLVDAAAALGLRVVPS